MSLPTSHLEAGVTEQDDISSHRTEETSQPPPSYTTCEAEPLPPYAPREYIPTAPGPATGTIQPATNRVPSALNAYWQWKFTRTILLGVSAEETHFAVSTRIHLFSRRQSIVLHDGPSAKHPVLGTLESDITGSARPCMISVPPPHRETGAQGPVAVELHSNPERKYHKEPSFSFSCAIGEGKGATQEQFEWRRSRGKEIKELDQYSSGWKLVRLSGTSRDQEVVALMVHNSSMSMTKAFQFALRGSGLLGAMGQDWEIMALISAVYMFNLDLQTATTVVATI